MLNQQAFGRHDIEKHKQKLKVKYSNISITFSHNANYNFVQCTFILHL